MKSDYQAKFKVKDVGDIEIDLSKDEYDKLASYCKSSLPSGHWKCNSE